MNRSKLSLLHITWRLILALSLALPTALVVDLEPAQAGGWPPLIGLIPAVIKRNRVYKTANSYIKEKNEYYDALRDTAAQQLLDRELTFGLRDNQVAAYIKLVNLIEEERSSMHGFAEGEKKEAYDTFMTTAEGELKGLILSTTPVTRVLGAFTDGINSSQGLIQGAITKLTGGAGGFMADVAKVRRIGQRMGIAGQLIGGKLGEALRKGSSRISALTKPVDLVEADLIQVMNELGEFGDHVADLQNQGYKPVASQTAREVAITLVTGEGDPAISLIADLLVAKHGAGGDFRERAKDIMLGTGAARCRAKVEQIRRVIFKMQLDPVGEEENEPDMFPSCSVAEVPSVEDEVAAAEIPAGEEVSSAEDADGDSADSDQGTGTDVSQPTAQAADAGDTGTESFVSENIWVLVSAVANPGNERTSFTGGTGDPVYFGEERFAGKSLTYTASPGFFSVQDVVVDHGYTWSDTTVSVNFDSPPARLEPGQEITLSASASHGGSVNEGGAGLGLLFQYSYLGRALDPIFRYAPFNPAWEGPSSQDWTFTPPIDPSEGSEFELWAGLWNSPPCTMVWTYQAQPNPNYSEEETPTQESSSPPPETEDDPVCAALRQDVASKVDIARGADTADLALGIIGHLSAALGDIQVNYCEGGSGAANKGTPIRIGDCVETGANGRGKITFNDRDDKYNADPTTLYISRGSKMCFRDFTVHRDDGRPGMIDHIRGAIRIITQGWRPGNSLGVDVSVKAAVTVASDIVLEYDPDLDLLRTYVNQGTVSVTDLQTGESQQLTNNQLLITHQDSIGSVERMSRGVWNDLLDEQDLDIEDSLFSGEPSDQDRTSPGLLGVGAGVVILVLAVGGVLVYRKRKKG